MSSSRLRPDLASDRTPGRRRTPGPAPAPAARPGVCFVGVGPGDEGLLTVRAVERLAAADVVVVDQLDRSGLLSRYCRDGVEVLDAGFGEDGQPMTRVARAKLVVRAARGGGLVVRLMDGDPSLFIGLPEEIAACRRADVPVEVVPGVSAVHAIPAYAGVMLIPSGAAGVHVVHPNESDVDWSVHADFRSVVVLLGTAADLAAAATALLKAGRCADSPVVLMAHGTTLRQRSERLRLAGLAGAVVSLAERLAGEPPDELDGPDERFDARHDRPHRLLAVVGEAAAGAVPWFEQRPLFGWRVLVPRTKDQAGPMVSRLAGYGAEAEVVPTISVEPPRTPQQMDKAVHGLVTGRYQWIGFTSVNAVRAVRERFAAFGLDARAFAGLRVAAVGGVTADALRAWGIEPDLVPDGGTEQSAAGLLEIWPPYDRELDPINRVFLPRADIATETLVAGLTVLGWEAEDVTAYRTVRAAPPPAPVREAIKGGAFDAVVFTSSSTVRNLVGIAGKPHPNTVVACIGPATAKSAREHGLRVDVLAPEPTAAAVVDALAEYGTGLRTSAAETGGPVVRPSRRGTTTRRSAR